MHVERIATSGKNIEPESKGICVFLLAILIGSSSPSAQSADDQSRLPSAGGGGKTFVQSGDNLFEPTVTQKEADLLNAAVNLTQDDPAAAITMLREKISKKTSPALDFALGNFYYNDGQLEEAEKAYQAAIVKMPKFRYALNGLARAYLMQDKPREAMEMFQSLVRDGQGDAESLQLLGHCLRLQEKFVQAEGAYRQSLVLAPDDSRAMRGLINCLIEQQRNVEVLSLTRDLQTADPHDVAIWNLRANAQVSLDQYGEAIRSLETARLLESATPAMLATLGDLYLNRDQPQESISAYRQAFSGEKPSVDHMLRAIQGFLFLESLEEAEQMLQRVRSIDSDKHLSESRRHRRVKLAARLAVLQGKLDDAMAAYTSVIRENPLDGESMLALAHLRITAEQFEDARMLFERAARISGFEARALVRQAQLEVDQDRYRIAVPLLESAQVFDEQPHVARYLEQVRRLAEP